MELDKLDALYILKETRILSEKHQRQFALGGHLTVILFS